MTDLRLAFVCDYAEEGWPSMDLVAAMLPRAVTDAAGKTMQVDRLQPSASPRLQRIAGSRWSAAIGDRVINRYWDYPRWLRSRAASHGVFHILDHTYAHLVHVLPAQQTVVTCHDLDAFRCVLDPDAAPQPWLFRQLVRRTLGGLRLAARVACVSEAVRKELVDRGLVERSRALVVQNGVHPAFNREENPAADAEAARCLGPRAGGNGLELLHVGIPIPRKRVDRAIEVLAAVARVRPGSRLVRDRKSVV